MLTISRICHCRLGGRDRWKLRAYPARREDHIQWCHYHWVYGELSANLLHYCQKLTKQDLPSRLPTQSSTLYSNNITKFLLSIGDAGRFDINLEDEVVRRSIVTHQGEILWPAPNATPPPTPVSAPKPVSILGLPIDSKLIYRQSRKRKRSSRLLHGRRLSALQPSHLEVWQLPSLSANLLDLLS
jgi:hypothetical protein